MRFLRTVATFLFLTASVVAVNAQLPTGSINGIGKDASGRVIEGVHILAEGRAAGFSA